MISNLEVIRLQFLYLNIFKINLAAVILETKLTDGRDTIVGESVPLPAVTAFLPVVGAFLEREELLAIQQCST